MPAASFLGTSEVHRRIDFDLLELFITLASCSEVDLSLEEFLESEELLLLSERLRELEVEEEETFLAGRAAVVEARRRRDDGGAAAVDLEDTLRRLEEDKEAGAEASFMEPPLFLLNLLEDFFLSELPDVSLEEFFRELDFLLALLVVESLGEEASTMRLLLSRANVCLEIGSGDSIIGLTMIPCDVMGDTNRPLDMEDRVDTVLLEDIDLLLFFTIVKSTTSGCSTGGVQLLMQSNSLKLLAMSSSFLLLPILS